MFKLNNVFNGKERNKESIKNAQNGKIVAGSVWFHEQYLKVQVTVHAP
jgi:hypothetical protein